MSKHDSTKNLPEIIRSLREHPQRMSPEMLADALEVIDARLCALEPCPEDHGKPHYWEPTSEGAECIYCNATRPKVCQ